MNIKGQNLVEFGVVVGLIAVASLVTLTFFGENVKSLFTGSSQEYKKQTAFKWKEADANTVSKPKAYSSNVPTGYNPYPVVDTKIGMPSSIAGIPITYKEDGSISFLVGKQEVILTPEIQGLTDVVFETSGAPALTELVKEIQYMINKHTSEYPQGVPIGVTFGTGNRISTQGYSDFAGNAEANIVTIQVGNDNVILQNDQSCTQNSGTCSKTGIYRLEGKLEQGTFSGNVTSNLTNFVNGTVNGTFTSDSNKTTIQTSANTTYFDFNTNKDYYYDWTFDLDNNKKFDLEGKTEDD